MKRLYIASLVLATASYGLFSCESKREVKEEKVVQTEAKQKTTVERISARSYPSIFQAWYGIDMPEQYPTETLEQRLDAAAKHDLLWEEPLSQLGEGVDLVLGLEWAGTHDGLSDTFDPESLAKAKANKARLLEKNPNMVLLFEVRWRDAPSSFLPKDSPWWLRNKNGEIEKGWLGGWEPFYLLNYDNPEFQDNVARQCKLALESGVYDGVMFDWSGHLDIIKKTRAAIGQEGLIIVNIHDDIEDGEKYAPYINGSFMELNPIDDKSLEVKGILGGDTNRNGRKWKKMREALTFFESHFQAPVINCLETWGNRDDLSRMRAVTTLGLTHSDGYTLYADPNPLKTPDHYHDWYPFWDVELGNPLTKVTTREDGAFQREYTKGTVIYNEWQNGPVTIQFEQKRKRASDGSVDQTFELDDRDGDIFLSLN
ncbi:putative glycoside hydrolase family 15 protein [Reichenbachiella ulvae]|uniref:Glycoside hydrolase family 15 protein n=1 Tax=Reichenbachiella ulvae TaxID=2980104 RepID=A0ABT3D020_9BACT|nr:putative glycoside hydrolase family 15 protein [Reichenbachiella ulvae]MCV9389285.1 putative glycoside hydrolase family 15 protein [Reichenbachiella ulvae]